MMDSNAFGSQVTMIMTTVFAILFNIIAILILLFKRGVMRLVDMLFVSMAVSDLAQGILVFPVDVASIYNGKFVFDNAVCQGVGFLHSFLAFTSIAHFGILSVCRVFAIWRPIKARNVLVETWVRILLIGLGWAYAFLWSAFPLLGWSKYALEPNQIICSVHWSMNTSHNKSYIYSLFVFCFFIPVFIMLTTGAVILLIGKYRIDPSAGQQRRNHSWKTLLVFLMFGFFIVQWIPYALVSFYTTLYNDPKFSLDAGVVCALFAKTYTLTNPLLCVLIHPEFRRIFKGIVQRNAVQPEPSRGSTTDESAT